MSSSADGRSSLNCTVCNCASYLRDKCWLSSTVNSACQPAGLGRCPTASNDLHRTTHAISSFSLYWCQNKIDQSFACTCDIRVILKHRWPFSIRTSSRSFTSVVVWPSWETGYSSLLSTPSACAFSSCLQITLETYGFRLTDDAVFLSTLPILISCYFTSYVFTSLGLHFKSLQCANEVTWTIASLSLSLSLSVCVCKPAG